ncbi:MAG: S-layer homology domain-containing protein, partial [Firmicutes bacterium]|nr:S-layer homology domain-containing protein [Bacillota bacterium]
TVGNAGDNEFSATYSTGDKNYKDVTETLTVTVEKAEPTYTVPSGLTATYGQTLADVDLPNGWTWVDPSTSVGEVGTNTFKATYSTGDANYEDVTVEVEITVTEASEPDEPDEPDEPSTLTLTVEEAPTASKIKKGKTLSASTLSGGVVTADGEEVSGSWAWADGTETMSSTGTFERTAVFTADEAAYGTVEATVSVKVYTASSGGGSSSGSSSSDTTDVTDTSSDSSSTSNVTTAAVSDGAISADTSTAEAGDTVTVTVTPDEGYVVETVTVTDEDGNEVEVTTNDDGTYAFVMPATAVSISATFTESDESSDGDADGDGTSSGTHVCPSEKFTDVDTSLWYHEYIDYALENGLMNGISDTTFEPNTATTRGMIVTILYRLEGEPTANSASDFTDVVSGAWYADAVAWAAENGIVNGYDNGKFGADDTITREQTAAILYRYAGYKGYDTSASGDITAYTDADAVSGYAVTAMQWAVGTGLIAGKEDNTLSPQSGATRAETAAMLARFIEAE